MKVEDVYSATKEAIRRAKAGEGPTLIECDTYRHYGHFEGDEQKYKSEADQNRGRDPIPEFRKVAVEKGWMTNKQADEIEKEAAETIKKASEFAQKVHFLMWNRYIQIFLLKKGRNKNDRTDRYIYDSH